MDVIKDITKREVKNVVATLMDDFNARMRERDKLEEDILEKETKYKKLSDLIINSEGKLAELTVTLTESQADVDAVEALVKSKEELTTLVNSLRVEFSDLKDDVKAIKKELQVLQSQKESQSDDLAQISRSCSEYMRNVATFTNDINRKRKAILDLEERQKKAYDEQLDSLEKEREELDKEKQVLAELRKINDIKLESIRYSTKDMPHYARHIQGQFNELGITVPFTTMLNKALNSTK
jgi:chromosome segregation ATPase